MARTWGDLQAETLQLMFSYSVNGVKLNNSADTADYRAAMAQAANFAMRDLAGTVAPIVRKYSLSLAPIPNMLGEGDRAFAAMQSAGCDISFTALDPKAFYFEADNPCAVYLEQVRADGTALRLQEFHNATRRSYQAHSGTIETAMDGAAIRLRFVGGTAYNIRNVAFYSASFASTAEVPPFTRFDRYDLSELTRGAAGHEFMKLVPNSVVSVSAGYSQSDSFHWEGDSVIVFDHYAAGQYDIYYHAYPTEIVAPNADSGMEGTPGHFVPELLPEALDIVPLYMASRLYAEDNPPLASQYLNQYAARKAELSQRDMPIGKDEIACESGWW